MSDGYRNECKDCINTKARSVFNPIKESKRKKEARLKNPEIFKARSQKYQSNNKPKINENARKQRAKNPEKTKEKDKIRRIRRKKDNPTYTRDYSRKRSKDDIEYKLKKVLRSRSYNAIKYGQKAGSMVKDLGCTVEELKIYLESMFTTGMTWKNHGVLTHKTRNWQIDHIVPLSKFDLTNREEFLKACHYSNLQPLWATDNNKKSNK